MLVVTLLEIQATTGIDIRRRACVSGTAPGRRQKSVLAPSQPHGAIGRPGSSFLLESEYIRIIIHVGWLSTAMVEMSSSEGGRDEVGGASRSPVMRLI